MSHPDWDQRFRLCHKRSLESADFWSPDFWSSDFWSPDLRLGPMASNNLLLEKNDTSKNEVQNSWRWAFSYCWSLQDMEALSRRLQTWGPHTHQSQQPPSIYRYEEFELQTSLLGLWALLLLFSNRLLSGQGKQSCRYVVLFLSKNQAEEDELKTKNIWIFHKLQSSLTNVSFSGLSTQAKLLPLHWVLICGTHVLPLLCQF